MKRILLTVIISLVLIIILVYLLLWIPPVQQMIKNIAVSELVKITKNQVSIGKIKLRPFNKVSLDDIYISDLKGDTLLYAKQLSAGFSLPELLRNKLLIKSVNLENFSVAVSKDSVNAPFNFQFLIDAFASKDTTDTSESSMIIEIDRVLLKQGQLSYNILSEDKLSEGFDFNHIHVYDFNTLITLKSIDVEKLNVAIKSLSLKESSGFEIKNLYGGVRSEDKEIKVDKLTLELPSSELNVSQVMINYTGMELADMLNGASYSLSIDIPRIHLPDLDAFYPPLEDMTDELRFNTMISGKFPAIDIETLQASLGDILTLNSSMNIDDFQHWDKSMFEIDIKTLEIKNEAVEKIINLTSSDTIPGSKSTFDIPVEKLKLTGKLKGSLPKASINLHAQTSTGNLELSGTGGYIMETENSNFDIRLVTQGFNLRSLLNNPAFGQVSMNLTARGKTAGANVDAIANANISRFDFNGYSYKDLSANGFYKKDSVDLTAISKDENFPLWLKASANLNERKESARLYAKVGQTHLNAINLMTENEVADLSLVLNADVRNFDIEKMKARLTVDSLFFNTETGIIKQGPIRVNYTAGENAQKEITISSDVLNGYAKGKIMFATISQTFSNTLSDYLPSYFKYKRVRKEPDENLDIQLKVGNVGKITTALNIPFSVDKEGIITSSYSSLNRFLSFNADFPQVKVSDMILTATSLNLKTDTTISKIKITAQTSRITKEPDTLMVRMNMLAGHDSISFKTNFEEISPGISVKGDLALNAFIKQVKNQVIPDIFVNVLPTTISLNDQDIQVNSSKIAIQKDYYAIDNFMIKLSETEYLSINGSVSKSDLDTLKVHPSHIQLATLMKALHTGIDLKGDVDGEIVLTKLLTSPLFFTRNLTIKDIALDDKKIGTFTMSSIWSDAFKGVGVKATLQQDNGVNSVISGFVMPAKDSIRVKADIKALQMDWITPFTRDFLYGLDGAIGAQVNVTGKLSAPDIRGTVSVDKAKLGIKMTNALYTLSDTINIEPGNIALGSLRLTDQNNKTAVISGDIKHKNFKEFTPKINVRLRDFLVVNNPNATDSLFYGTLRLNGSADITGSEKNLLVNMSLSNSGKGKIFVRIPDTETQATQFTGLITYVNPADTLDAEEELKITRRIKAETTLPVKLNISLNITPDLTLGTIINPETKDEASVTGTGNIDFSYNLGNGDMSILGDYTISDGKCALSLKNITKRTFSVQPGGKIHFNGDPMKTSFDVTAVYSLRADLTTLDQSFANNSYVTSTRVNVNCLVGVSGNMDKMKITYDIALPNSSEELQQQVAGLIYSDDIKIREIAYLLAVGAFWPPEDSGKSHGSNLWTSLASSTLTTVLNSLLSGVLNENWSIGTELHTDDDNSNMEMDVNVSTRLFNDRLTVTGNLGYKNNSTTNTNFTGDFEASYKLTKSGDLVLKMYNVTNDQYYEQALTTQGVGILYKKEAKTFKELFRKIKERFRRQGGNRQNQSEKEENK